MREALNAISAVINNRPSPIREFDQIYMKTGDMLLQTEFICNWFAEKEVTFIGDGDSIALSAMFLAKEGIVQHAPKKILVLDFDERIVNAINSFSGRYKLNIAAKLYNVAHPLPEELWQRFDGFYTNPPYGASNKGKSIESFILRGIEASKPSCSGCIVLADHLDYPWTQDILMNCEKFLLRHSFCISQLIPQFHTYHLDDNPDLSSCNLCVKRRNSAAAAYASVELPQEWLKNFYGQQSPLQVKHVRDLTNAGKMASNDYQLEPLNQ